MLFSRFLNVCFVLASTTIDLTRAAAQSKAISRFEIHLTNAQVDPIGAGSRPGILINGSFIGPTLHVEQGVEVEFVVRNYMKENTTVHFHGIAQSKTPWSDGVPGLSQGQIRPGASFLYRWVAEDAGTFYYHSHANGQSMDGLYGAIIVAVPAEAERPFHLISQDKKELEAMLDAEQSLQPLLVSDWSQFSSAEFYQIEKDANLDFACMDAIMVNGVGSQYCLDSETLDSMTNPLVLEILRKFGHEHMTAKGCIPPIQVFQGDFDLHLDTLPPQAFKECVGGQSEQGNFTVKANGAKGWIALSFINAGALYPLQVAIDSHEMWVYAVDGHYVKPVVTDRILINNGNRISVMVKLDKQPARYTIRLASDLLNQVLGGFAELVYDDSTNPASDAQPKMDYGGNPIGDDVRTFITEDSQPFPAVRPGAVDKTVKVLMRKLGRPKGAFEWSITGSLGYNISEEYRDPALLFQDPSTVHDSELILKNKLGEWVDFIIVTEGPFAQSHPLHKHGNRVFVLGQQVGDFPWETVEEGAKHLPEGTFNFVSPPLLDTFTTVDIEGQGNNTWTVIRYHVESSGAWLIHCHVQSHLTGGMGMVILDGVGEFPEVPIEYREWNGFAPPSVEFSSQSTGAAGKSGEMWSVPR